MFDSNNVDAFWGFGLIMGQRASQEAPETNLKESIRFLRMAKERSPKNGQITGDLAFSHTILGHYYKSEKKKDKEAEDQFAEAGKLFADAFKADPQYPPTVANCISTQGTTKKPRARLMKQQRWATSLALITSAI